MDEFTSTLDRTVARTASAALARLLRTTTLRSALRTSHLPHFIALTCHTDILPWLQPDWVLDLGGSLAGASGWCGEPRLIRERLQRPRIVLDVRRVPQRMWSHFARHHYLSGGLAASATCYAAWWEEAGARGWGLGTRASDSAEWPSDSTAPLPSPKSPAPSPFAPPVAFCAVVAALGWKKTKRIARLVTLPEFQGLGIRTQLAERVAAIESARGNRVTITASHPAIVSHCSHSPHWRLICVKKTGSTRQRFENRAVRCSTGRAVASFEYANSSSL